MTNLWKGRVRARSHTTRCYGVSSTLPAGAYSSVDATDRSWADAKAQSARWGGNSTPKSAVYLRLVSKGFGRVPSSGVWPSETPQGHPLSSII